MNEVDSLIKEFNGFVERKEKAEKWFDDPKTTDSDRELMTPELLKVCNRLVGISKELESLGYKVHSKAFWEGIQ